LQKFTHNTNTDHIVPTGLAALHCILGQVLGTLGSPAWCWHNASQWSPWATKYST